MHFQHNFFILFLFLENEPVQTPISVEFSTLLFSIFLRVPNSEETVSSTSLYHLFPCALTVHCDIHIARSLLSCVIVIYFY